MIYSIEDFKLHTLIHIKNIEDFKLHTLIHIKNVELITHEILRKIKRNPFRYNNVFEATPNEIIRYTPIFMEIIKTHDLAKLDNTPKFLSYYKLKSPLLKALYSFYGKGINSPGIKKFVKLLNIIDDDITIRAMRRAQLPMRIQKAYLEIERLADCTERGMNPITPLEMGSTPMRPSEYLREKIGYSKLQLVRELEFSYAGLALYYSDYKQNGTKVAA